MQMNFRLIFVLLSIVAVGGCASVSRSLTPDMRNSAAGLQEENIMKQVVLIDTFVVPDESKAKFLESAKKAQKFLKTLPGFIEGYLFEKKSGDGRHNVITTAVWEDNQAFENAKKAISAQFQKDGFNPQEFRKKLNIVSERSVYERFPY
jgi:heme-degrading monooxygenase HmoA